MKSAMTSSPTPASQAPPSLPSPPSNNAVSSPQLTASEREALFVRHILHLKNFYDLNISIYLQFLIPHHKPFRPSKIIYTNLITSTGPSTAKVTTPPSNPSNPAPHLPNAKNPSPNPSQQHGTSLSPQRRW